LADTQTDEISAKLSATADAVGNCLTNRALVRGNSEEGSTPSIHFSGGARQPFWQVSMVPSLADPSRIQPEILILGPAPVARTMVAAPKVKRVIKRKKR
jgi:hypothetical protein